MVLLRILTLSLLGFALSFCASNKEKEEVPRFDQHESQGEYEQGERGLDSKDYEDDDYGDADEDGEDESALSEDEEDEFAEVDDDEVLNKLGQTSSALKLNDMKDDYDKEEVQDDPLEAPVKDVPAIESAPKKSAVKAFKNGMYKVRSNCSMRSRPSTRAKKVGKVRGGKRLWMEKHNQGWVKIFKKSGPVFISKKCL